MLYQLSYSRSRHRDGEPTLLSRPPGVKPDRQSVRMVSVYAWVAEASLLRGLETSTA
jgi:hypothetical protein